MLSADEARAVGAVYGAALAQVERDHLISHCLWAIGELARPLGDPPEFYGGTALARTWLADSRLSEDIDLYAKDRGAVVEELEGPRGLSSILRREFPELEWQTPLSAVRDTEPAFLRSGQLVLKIQLLRAEGGYEQWPTEIRPLVMRYGDCLGTRLAVPTLPAFAAMKTSAWADRRAPRDLWDLAKLAGLGAIDAKAARLLETIAGVRPAPHLFASAPSDAAWREALSGQTADVGKPDAALAVCKAAWAPYF